MVWGFPIQWEKYISSVVVDFPTSFYNMMKARFKIGCTKFHFQPGQDCPNISEKKEAKSAVWVHESNKYLWRDARTTIFVSGFIDTDPVSDLSKVKAIILCQDVDK